MIKKDIYMIN